MNKHLMYPNYQRVKAKYQRLCDQLLQEGKGNSKEYKKAKEILNKFI